MFGLLTDCLPGSPSRPRPGKVNEELSQELALKKSDTKRNRFTVEVMADDKRIEKKDKTANEPVQFYVASKARQPYEIVVNQIAKDSVSGYLAKPKVTVASG